ncbi:MAG TPA: hypothetical protein DCQ92_07350 [Verrucomicrobia subdivision 3 bacterium]|nr:hypothetical protein [Limisphaerales bacterium]
MIVTATQMATDSNGVIDRVVERHEKADIRRHGKIKVELRRKAGVSKSELLEILESVRFSTKEQADLTAAMKQANQVFGYAGGH